jgi:hypothetical protein
MIPPNPGRIAVSESKIAIILGSTRPGRNGKAVADWVFGQASGRPGAHYDLIDLADRGEDIGSLLGRNRQT